MKKLIIVFLFVFPFLVTAQSFQSLDTISPSAAYENIYTRIVASDSSVSSFVIFIKKEVKAHKHNSHAEHIYVLDGTGEMQISDKLFQIKKGDIFFVPKNTIHSLKVTSTIPVKVLSIQTPMFDGKDRIFVEPTTFTPPR